MEIKPWQRMLSRFYLTVIGIKRRMTLGVRVVLLDGNRVFLIRHTYLPGWQFPGGGVEPGETA
jgi:8-oxo-dGTP pyrophosphatase MutT (NUDIX family)